MESGDLWSIRILVDPWSYYAARGPTDNLSPHSCFCIDGQVLIHQSLMFVSQHHKSPSPDVTVQHAFLHSSAAYNNGLSGVSLLTEFADTSIWLGYKGIYLSWLSVLINVPGSFDLVMVYYPLNLWPVNLYVNNVGCDKFIWSGLGGCGQLSQLILIYLYL